MDFPTNKQFHWPTFSQWKRLPRVLSRREQIILLFLVLIFAVTSFSLVEGLYVKNTQVAPSHGGTMVEGVVGAPRFINPVYADANDIDRDLISLIYSGLYQLNTEGKFVPDLAISEPEITEGGRTITVTLRDDVIWQDGNPFGADDVLFTIATIKDPRYKSPIRANWLGVEVEKVSDHIVRFHLLDPYGPFIERLALKILPAHLWGQSTPEDFTLSSLNLKPIGTGPYKVAQVQVRSNSIHEIHLQASPDYYGEQPFIENIVFRFFENEEDLIREANQGGIQSLSLTQISNISRMRNPKFLAYSFQLPRTFSLFFNLDPAANSQFKESEIRQALALALNKEELVQNVFQGDAHIVESPLRPDLFEFTEPDTTTYDPDAALAILERAGYTEENGILGKPAISDQALARDLDRGASGEEVRRLQQCLASLGPDIYPEGTVNGNYGALTQSAVIRFQEKYAEETLAPLGLTKGTGKAGPLTREKLNLLCFAAESDTTPLVLNISLPEQETLQAVAQELKRQWGKIGIQVELHIYSSGALERDVIGPRAYETLLFGQVLGLIPDPYPFWHSNQAVAPGANFSSYQNRDVDRLLEETRKTSDSIERLEILSDIQPLLLADVPALFLYDLDYRYFVSREIQGVQSFSIADPSQRFADIEKWYAETKRIPK